MENKDSSSDEELKKKFKNIVIAWVQLDDKIKTINSELKNMKDEKKQYEDFILDFMEKYNENMITLSNGVLKKNVSQTKQSINEEMINEAIEEFTKDAEQAYTITQKIIQKRQVNEKVSLKRQVIKKKNN
jgi:ABC-type transporter lipoprotein component MlaA